MPSLKKTVRGIFRQFSFNGGTNGTTSEANGTVEDGDAMPTVATVNGPPLSLRHQWPVNDVIYDYHHAFTNCAVAPEGVIKNGHCTLSFKNRGGSFHNRRTGPGYYAVGTLDGYRRLSARENGLAMDASFIHMYLTGRLKKRSQPEIYFGKTGVDLPVLQIVPLDPTILAAQSGPAGGLTQVPCVNKRPIVKIANLDDELNLSFDADIDTLSASSCATSATISELGASSFRSSTTPRHGSADTKKNGLKPNPSPIASHGYTDWDSPHDRAHGLSTSLYERHPFTHLRAGDPVADVFAVCARPNSCVLALADGVNWGEKSRLAARCAIRGAVDHLSDALYDKEKPVSTTSDVFRCLLRAFHAGHQLILQEGGSLTTLCVVIVCQLKDDQQWVVCSCNVGDSLAFVYSEKYGVREVTLGSHDIQQMRDMRDAGGALGPVDGVNPELHNFTCSMTLVDKDDFIFLTSDGVSDNFDPVVGKFCIIQDDLLALKNAQNSISPQKNIVAGPDSTKTLQTQEKNQSLPKSGLTCLKSPISLRRADAASISVAAARKTGSLKIKPVGHVNEILGQIPVVEAHQRHELMLLRMEYLIRRRASKRVGSPLKTARDLCENLLNFAMELTTAKRALLEDPELYRCENPQNAQKDQRYRRRYVRQRIATLPGKLDHATVVAYRVGEAVVDNQSWTGHDDRSEVSTLAGSIAETRSEPVTTFYSRPATAKDRAITTPTQEGQNMEARLVKAVCPEPPLISEVTVKMRKSISLSAGSQRSSLQGVEESLEEDTAASSLPSSHAGGDHSLQGDTAPSPAHGTSEVSGRSSSLSDSDIETIVCDPVSVAEATSETLSDLQDTSASPVSQIELVTSSQFSEHPKDDGKPERESGTATNESIDTPAGEVATPRVDITKTVTEDTYADAPSAPPLSAHPTSSVVSPSDEMSKIPGDPSRTLDACSRPSGTSCAATIPPINLDALGHRTNPRETASSLRSPELRLRRKQMNDSYYIATSHAVANGAPEKGSQKPEAEAGASTDRPPSSGRFRKLSKALDRIERAVRRKHRRGSPNRHTVSVDPSVIAEARDKYETMPCDRRVSAFPAGNSSKTIQDTDPSPSLLSSPASRRTARFRWSPIKVFRTWTTRGSITQSDYCDKRSKESDSARSADAKSDRQATSISVSPNHGRSVFSEIGSFPHSASDTQIVRLAK